jgi:L,D-transpeptidase YcfS
MRVSSGCIRLRDDDIKTLYNVVTPGTKVNIINTPIKVSEEPGGVRLVKSISRCRKTSMTIRRRCPLT